MKRKRRITHLSILALAVLMSLSACGNAPASTTEGAPTSSAASGGTSSESNSSEASESTGSQEPVQDNLVVAVPQDPDFLDPHKAVASGTEEMMFNVFEGLLKPEPSGKLFPAVASAYTVSEDGLTYTFTLRDGIRFHNGNPVTIEDVAFSYKRLRGDFSSEPLSPVFKDIQIDVVDTKTITFTLKEVDASFAVHFMEAVVPAGMDDEAYNKTPIGTGPYRFVEYMPSQRIVLEKFDDYWGEKAHISHVEFRIFADQNAALISLMGGEVDMYPRIPVENLDALPEGYTFFEGKQNTVQLMAMNTAVEPLDDLRVRQAINYAVDTQMVIDAVADGMGTPLGSNMSPAMPLYYQEGLENRYAQDLDKAKSLLKEAGYANGFDIEITVPSNYVFHVKSAEVIAEQLKAVDIQATIKSVEWGVWLDEVYKGRNYEMTIIGLTGKLDPHNVLWRYVSDYGRNFMNFSNAEYDTLLNAAKSTIDETKRAELYKKAQIILADEVPAVYIMDPNFVVAHKETLKGYRLYPMYIQDIAALHFD